MKLKPETWCCFREKPSPRPSHSAFDCVGVPDCRVEYFYADGRYDEGVWREHALVSEVGTPRAE